jgi:hypothetical protein
MLREYLKLFNDFTKTSFSVAKICRYLSRYWIPANLTKQVQAIEVREIYPVSDSKLFFFFVLLFFFMIVLFIIFVVIIYYYLFLFVFSFVLLLI